MIPASLPPRVAHSPLGQLLRWIADPVKYLEENYQQYGDCFIFVPYNLLKLVVVSDPEAVQEIFNLDAKLAFISGPSNSILLPLVGSESLFLSDGDRHKRERKLLMPPFHGERLQNYAQNIQEITQQACTSWQDGDRIIARKAMQDITLEIIIQVVFGLREGKRYQEIKPLLEGILDSLGSPLSSAMLFFKFLQQDWGAWSPWGKMQRSRAKVYQILQEEIAVKRENLHNLGTDILSIMLQATDENGQYMSDQEIQDQLISLLIAGHETTATSLAWVFYLLGQNASVYQKLLEEIDSLESAEPMAMAKLPYLNAVCQETLRMYPVVPIATPREPKETIEIGGYIFSPGMGLAPCIQLIHYREDIYPNPHQFQPERFLERQYTTGEFLPFGGGNRRCIGYALALLEFKLVLGTILQTYQPELVSNQILHPRRRGVTLSPAGGVPLKIYKRTAQPSQVLSLKVVEKSTN